MYNTQITRMFGVQYPIICGAMMWLCKPSLCAAVCNAGGIGNLTAANYETEDEFRAAIRETRRLTDKPFFIGITLLPSIRITAEHHKMYVKVCAEEKVAGIEFSGTPLDKVAGMEAVELLKKAGVKLFHKVGAVRHALHAEKIGFDGVYAAGIEEGGHPLNDDVTTMILTPRMVESVKIPVVTVGGIANGRTMAAALTLGAQGVMMASRFIATKECEVHDNIKQELIRRQPPAGLSAVVVVSAHHGSRSSSSPAFVDATLPEHVIHSAGSRNSFGHPHPDVWARWSGAGARNWRTDAQGAIVIEFAAAPGDGVQVSAVRETRPRYWHGR